LGVNVWLATVESKVRYAKLIQYKYETTAFSGFLSDHGGGRVGVAAMLASTVLVVSTPDDAPPDRVHPDRAGMAKVAQMSAAARRARDRM
jgi:hypothetical protein